MSSAVAALAGAMALTGCGSASKAGAAKSGSISIGYFPGAVASLPVIVADKQGFFKKNGLKVSLVTSQSAPVAIAALVRGSVDFTMAGTDQFMEASGKLHQPVEVVAGMQNAIPFSLVARQSYPTPTLARGFPADMQDFRHAKIGLGALGASEQGYVTALFKSAGITPSASNFRAVGLTPAAVEAALSHGTVDAYLSIDPITTQVVSVAKTAKMAVDLGRLKPFTPFAFGGLGARASTVRQRPAVVKKLQNAMRQAAAFIADPSNTGAVAQDAVSGLGLASAQFARKVVVSDRSQFGYDVSRTGYQNMATFLAKTGQPEAARVSYAELIAPGTRG